MKLEDILRHPADQEMVFDGPAMAELLEHLVEVQVKAPHNSGDPDGLAPLKMAAASARKIILSPQKTPPSHGIPIAYMLGRHWTFEPKDCKHGEFRIGAEIGRILKDGQDSSDPNEEPAYYSASIRVRCQHCGDPFEFVGLPFGFSPYHPTVSIDGQVLSISVMPVGVAVQPGLAGFKVTQTVFDEKAAVKQ